MNDVDRVEDIPQKISVIIPALNEQNLVGSAVKSALEGFNAEALVVDGGSTDATRENASDNGAKVLTTSSCKALQMNYGARHAAGNIFLFLHADSRLPPAWDCYVRNIIKKHQTALGFFRFAVNEPFPGSRLIEWGTNLRSRFLKLPYEDQGLFLSRYRFFSVGGFPDVPFLEDVFLVRRIQKSGHVCCAGADIVTSGRRWIKFGVLRTTFINQAVLLSAWLGVDPLKLKEDYHKGTNPLTALFRKRRGSS